MGPAEHGLQKIELCHDFFCFEFMSQKKIRMGLAEHGLQKRELLL